MSSAREDILGRVRSALRDVPRDEDALPPAYQPPPAASGDAVARFVERVGDYRATVREADDVAAIAARVCAEHGARRVAIPATLTTAWRPEGVELLGAQAVVLDEVDPVGAPFTGESWGHAEAVRALLAAHARDGRR